MSGSGAAVTLDSDEDSSSSTSSSDVVSPEQQLEQFRRNWKNELKVEAPAESQSDQATPSSSDDEETRARSLYLEGAELEKLGKVFEAMRLYRRALQLVPDIERKVYESTKHQLKGEMEREVTVEAKDLDMENGNIDDDEDLTGVDLMVRFQAGLLKSGRICERSGGVVSDKHFKDLPFELILLIFRWVVGNLLDMRSLESCALVCRGFYLCARDPEIWRNACIKVWGVNVGALKGSSFISWRQMFFERDRVLFNGCYISTTSYLRYGENSFQDQFYRPVQLIEYYRLMRFFPDGQVLMITSADDPRHLVTKLRNRNVLPAEVLSGHYRFHNDYVVIVLTRSAKASNEKGFRRGRRTNVAETNTTVKFLIEMKIQSTSKRRFCKLAWDSYSVIHIRNKTEISTEFDLTPAKYPPLIFSRVKSYQLESESMLE